MELKMKYHYSYFIYPYVIKENKFSKYIKRFMDNSKFKPKLFNRTKDNSIYEFFLPTIRKYMFRSFEFGNQKIRHTHTLDDKLIQNDFKSSPCVIFQYDIGNDMQAKVNEEDGIFFKIEEMEVICFKSGICFLTMKTTIEDTDRFSDFLNFNVKFRSLNSEVEGLEKYNNIKIQTSKFGDIRKLADLIHEITGNTKESEKIDVDVNKFLIYSYVCIDQEYWNDSKPFSELRKEFSKFANVLEADFNSSFDNEKLRTVSFGNFIKMGISSLGVNLITSSINTVNYTNLPFEFENEYLYTYIFALYEKIYLSKIINSFGKNLKNSKASKEFFEFTDKLWVHLVTGNDNGTLVFSEMKNALELDKIYETAKAQYDISYKNFKMKNGEIINKVILLLLAASIVTNIINFVNLFRLKG